MEIEFFKYQGTGNDFVLIDNRNGSFPKTDTDCIKYLCDRRFGIGGDGLILLENDDEVDFKMVYFNSDGAESTMCGNGGRCMVAFAKHLGVINTNETNFRAVDGLHAATMEATEKVKLKMKDVDEVIERESHLFLDTGSPHHVQMVKNIDGLNVQLEGSKIRYGLYGQSGSNVNFVEPSEGRFKVRTYERGVEAETLSCGTGVTAVAIAMHAKGFVNDGPVVLDTPGGELWVDFETNASGYQNIYLTGPAQLVFKGTVSWKD
ncbi:MAG: diaminopimelate epimerase [Bacteroidota bacterium]